MIEELRDLVAHDNANISEDLVQKASSLKGTRPYWWRARAEFESLVYNQGTPASSLL